MKWGWSAAHVSDFILATAADKIDQPTAVHKGEQLAEAPLCRLDGLGSTYTEILCFEPADWYGIGSERVHGTQHNALLQWELPHVSHTV